jgi:hypothetical protein
MAGATNTIIQILRSSTTAYPSTLNPGEQAYSHVSDKLFIGNTDNSVVTIGGKYYVDLLDNATDENTGNTIVRRDIDGNVEFTMVSVTDSASQSTDVVNKNYLDSRIAALSSNTIYDGTFGQDGYSNVHVDSVSGGGSVIVIANNETVATFTSSEASFVQDVLVSGNLTVKGETSYTNVTTLLVDNNDIVMNANASGQPLIDAYITVNRGAADNAAIRWNEAIDTWQLDSGFNSYYDIVHTGGGQTVSGTTTLSEAVVQNLLDTYSLSVQTTANVNSLTANGTIYTNQLVVASNVQLANVANVAYYANMIEATSDNNEETVHHIMLSHDVSGNNRFQANTLLSFDVANTTLEVGYSSYTPLPNTMYQGTGSSLSYIQNNLQNLNNEGSADYVVTADNGSDSTGFLDMGMAGGNYNYLQSSGETGPFKPNDGFIQVVGSTGIGKGNLIIATGTANTDFTEVGSIILSVGNQTYANIVGYITRENNSTTGTPTFSFGKGATANSSYAFDLAGSANVASLYINNTKILGEGFALPTPFGGTGLTSVTQNAVLFGNGSGTLGVTNAPTTGQVLQYRTDGVKFGGLDGGTF